MIAPAMIEISKFALLASDVQIKRTVQALEANNIHVIVTEDGADAKKTLYELIPANAEVFTSSSETLNVLGIPQEIDKSGRYNSVREKMSMMAAENLIAGLKGERLPNCVNPEVYTQ